MWEGISGLITLAVLIIKAWADHAADLKKEHNDAINAIHEAAASGDVSLVNAVIQRLRR